jgi:NADH:ubiquinone oxidoreductase subunit 5 (subunit L)/multisubunit Na+/H+ antiporter MnhA subunit
MTLPLVILAIGSALVGFLGFPHANMFEEWLKPVLTMAGEPKNIAETASDNMEYILMFVSVIVAFIGIITAYVLYISNKSILDGFKNNPAMKKLYAISFNKWYFDELYNKVIICPLMKISDLLLWRFIDKSIIDGLVNGTAKFYYAMSYGFRDIQSGKVRHYALSMLFGIVMIFVYVHIKK